MDEFDPVPSPESENGSRRWQEGTDTFGRVYAVLLGIRSPTPYTEIAETADCSPNAAKKHLDRLTEMGIAESDTDGRPAKYARNDGYLEWQEASRIANALSVEEIRDRVRELEAKRTTYEERFETTDPATLSAVDAETHDAVHERMEALSDWKSIIRDVRLYDLARRLAENDGHLIPA
jgi:predicted ArsR family transcriptional regulator